MNLLSALHDSLFLFIFQIGDDSGEDCDNSSVVCEQKQEDEEFDVTDLSSLDNHQLCLRYQQVNFFLFRCFYVFIFNLAKISLSIFGLLLSLQLQSKLHSRASQLIHAKERVG